MTGIDHVEVRTGRYYDSVTLMQASQAVAATPGLLAAQLAMGTDLNLEVVRGMGFAVPDQAGPTDLLVALRSQDDEGLAAGRQAVDAVLAQPRGSANGGAGSAAEVAALTVGSALSRTALTRTALSGTALGGTALGGTAPSRLVLVSVPGPHAFTEAMDALDHGAHVMVFSDNVSVAQEVRLKQIGAERGLLVMGPDCGTAVVSGVGLGFANVVAPGPVGVVAASGTGAQQVLALLDGAGVGVSHCLGVGGRDLSAAVGGRSTRQAMAMLDDDPATALILVVSKPPDPQVEAALVEYAATLSTPVRFATLGAGRPDLTAAARGVVEGLGLAWSPPSVWPAALAPAGRFGVLRGGFCGGTLCDEAMVIAAQAVGPVASNIPLEGAPRLGPTLDAGPGRHAFVDFGDDELTRGRPHPMIDATPRAQWVSQLAEHAGSPGNGVVLLLDVVLGHGAHPDPVADLAPALSAARARCAERGVDLAVLVCLCGTDGDPQGLTRQAQALQGAGADVFRSNADAARAAVALLGTSGGAG